MKIFCFGFLLVLRAFSTIYRPESIKIENCDDSTDSGTSVTDVIKQVDATSKNILGTAKGDTKIVMVESTATSITKTDLCRKDDSTVTSKEYYHVKNANIKSFLYKVSGVYKFIVVGSEINSAMTAYEIDTAQNNGKVVVVDYIKCLKSDGLDTFKAQYNNKAKPYIEGASGICFVPFLMTGPVVVSKTEQTAFTITFTPYSQSKCPTCQDIQKPQSCTEK